MKSKDSKIFIMLGIILVVVIAAAIAVTVSTQNVMKTMVCRNTTGTLTIKYDNKEITNYKIEGTGVKFNMLEANTAIKGVEGKEDSGMGVDAYLASFQSDFVNKQGGACQYI